MKLKVVLLAALLLFCGCAAKSYPAKSVTGVVQWGAGGGTDSLMRPLATLAQKELGESIVVQNKAGGAGTIGTAYVHGQPADGYTLLMGAENPALYPALGLSALSYADFDCLLLIGDETVGVVVAENSSYQSFAQLMAAAASGELRLATTGTGGLPWQVAALLTHSTGNTFNQIPYDSDATALAAVMRGECDFTVCKLQIGLPAQQSGALRYLTLLAKAPSPALPGVEPITQAYPEFEQYLPWGPFYGVFVKKGCPPDAVERLTEAFQSAYATETYQAVLQSFWMNPLGLSGEEAATYITNWQDATQEALKSTGAIQ